MSEPQPRTLPQRFAVWLAKVTAVPVGKEDDALRRIHYSGTEIDKPWADLQQEFSDVRDAWRNNPLARRLIGLQVAYVISDGIHLHAKQAPLKKYLDAFWSHPKNNMPLRQAALYEELARTGELFITLHTNVADGMCYVRAIPASRIDKIETQPGDYETELTYHEEVTVDDPDYDKGGRTWLNPNHPKANVEDADKRVEPVMLHYAINRPIGALRGESDLANILPWLRRYNRWLEDRVRLNAAMRSFLWVLHVPARLVEAKMEQYRRPPEGGTVVVAEKDAEEWQALTPTVNAGDAKADGRAIKYMVLAGSTGLALTDLGEGEDANLATAKAMGEQKTRWLGQRQALFGFILQDIALTAYNRAVRLGKVRGKEADHAAITVSYPDINPADNSELAGAAKSMADAFTALAGVSGAAGETWQRRVLRLTFQAMGQELSDEELDKFIEEAAAEKAKAEALQAQQFAQQGGGGFGGETTAAPVEEGVPAETTDWWNA